MIQYDATIPFVEHFGMYQVPDTLADAVEQYRIDSLRTAMEKLHVGPEIFELLVTEDDSVTDDFGSLCDPIAYYADSSLSYMNPATSASLPPVPSTLAELGVGGPALWIIPPVPKALKQADSAAISKVATLTATSFCDIDFVVGDREANLRYIALNSVDHPASMVLRESKIWVPYRRQISLPDMVAVRKADFVRLFTTLGVPLEARELECLSREDLVSCATDIRSCILERNRHVVFCKACAKKMLYLNAQVMSAQTEHVC
jgi:hypothetical protein